jgi:hypothetical protein
VFRLLHGTKVMPDEIELTGEMGVVRISVRCADPQLEIAAVRLLRESWGEGWLHELEVVGTRTEIRPASELGDLLDQAGMAA